MTTYYEVDMQAGAKELTVKYRIIENELTDIWKGLVRNIISSKDYDTNIDYQWAFVSYDEGVCRSIVQRMKETAVLWNENPLSVDTGKIEIPDIDAATLPSLSLQENEKLRNKLNRLHEMFHAYAEKTTKTSFSPLDQLNKDIHALETQVISAVSSSTGDRRTSSSFFLSGETEKEKYIESDSSLYKFFHCNVGETRTGLFLGYHTVGKDIRNCVIDNDIELVKNNMVRPQISISTECLCRFEENVSTNERSIDSIAEEVDTWIKSHHLESHIDMSLACNRATDRPKLGELVSNVDFEEIYEMMSSDDFKIIKCRLVDY